MKTYRAVSRSVSSIPTRQVALVATLIVVSLSVAPSAFATKKTPKKGSHASATSASKMVTTASGLKYEDTKVGSGKEAQSGQTVSVHYTGWLYEHGKKGKQFDSSRTRGRPFEFGLGAGQVIRGWDEGVAGMKIGGQRTLIIPSDLGYGPGGTPDGTIPPGATLLFEVELLAVN